MIEHDDLLDNNAVLDFILYQDLEKDGGKITMAVSAWTSSLCLSLGTLFCLLARRFS
jgi:hypothetical protein